MKLVLSNAHFWVKVSYEMYREMYPEDDFDYSQSRNQPCKVRDDLWITAIDHNNFVLVDYPPLFEPGFAFQ